MTRAQISLLLRVKSRAGFYSLGSGHGSVLNICYCFFKVGRGSSDLKVVSNKVVFFCLFELGADLVCVSLVVICEVCFRKVVTLGFEESFWQLIAKFEVVGFDRCDKVLVWFLNGFVGIFVRK